MCIGWTFLGRGRGHIVTLMTIIEPPHKESPCREKKNARVVSSVCCVHVTSQQGFGSFVPPCPQHISHLFQHASCTPMFTYHFPVRGMAYLISSAGWDHPTMCDGQLTAFDSTSIPSLPMSDYLKRFLRDEYCAGEVLVLACLYVNKLGIKSTPWREHRMALACVFLAEKYLEDTHLSLRRMAQIGGVSVEDLLRLERDAIALLNWQLAVSLEEFEMACHSVYMVENEIQTVNHGLKQEAVAAHSESGIPAFAYYK